MCAGGEEASVVVASGRSWRTWPGGAPWDSGWRRGEGSQALQGMNGELGKRLISSSGELIGWLALISVHV